MPLRQLFRRYRLAVGRRGARGRYILCGDGLAHDDLFVGQPGGLPNGLYLHRPDGTLRDVSAEAILSGKVESPAGADRLRADLALVSGEARAE